MVMSTLCGTWPPDAATRRVKVPTEAVLLAVTVRVSDTERKFCGGMVEGVLTNTPYGVEPTQNAES